MRRCIPLLILLTALACHRKPSTPPEVVARVGDRMLTLADFKRYLERNAGTDLAQVNPEVASAMLDQWIDEIVLSEYAATHGVEVPAEAIAQAVRNDAGATVIEKRDEMRRQKLIASLNADVPDPSDTEIRDEYDKHPNEFKSGEEVHVRQILVHDEDLANQIVARLRKGEHFEDLSSQYSLAPNAKKGGDIGYVSRGELPKMFEDAIFALKPGQISNVIRTDSSFHVFRVDERRGPGTIDLQTAAPVIRQRLHEDAVRDRIAQLVAKSRSDLPISILPRRLPFKYTGTLPKSENE
ncbi:MAG TPA: peptidyl-prolyl cis-trans isomerase [Thermoanaerobaculia bacterium]